MGTNFYANDRARPASYGRHIGKRAAAGYYCWDCQRSLCKVEGRGVHDESAGWHETCPGCNQSKGGEPIRLRRDESAPRRKLGVASCCSFSWDIRPEQIRWIRKFVDDCGRVYTTGAFLEVLEECPIRFYDLIGTDFS